MPDCFQIGQTVFGKKIFKVFLFWMATKILHGMEIFEDLFKFCFTFIKHVSSQEGP